MSRCLLLTLLALSVASLRAETFTIEGAVSRALKSNPDLAAARWSIEEARGRLWQSGRLPNPELEAELKPNIKGREFSLSAGFVQKFPLTNRLWLERAISEAELKMAEAEIRNAERVLAAEVRTHGVKLQALEGLRSLKENQRKNSAALGEESARIAKAGEGSGLEAAQFELESQQLSLDLLQVDSERALSAGMLRPLLGMKPGEPVTVTGDLAEPSAVSGASSLEQRPDYQMAQSKEHAARAGIDLARALKWDDPSYGLTAEFERSEDAPEGLRNDGFIGFKLSFPLPLRNKNEGRIHEASAAASRAVGEREALAGRIRAEAAAAANEMAVAAEVIARVSGTLLPKAAELEEAFSKAHKEGQAQLTDVLRSREKRFTLEAARLNALRDWHLARVRLLAARGR